MDTMVVVFIVAIAVFLIGTLVVPYFKERKLKQKKTSTTPDTATKQLQLQAYERLILLVDRIALPNLIPRLSQPGFTAKEMQLFIIENIKQEFEYNVTQQMYVSADAWTAVKNLKEQNIAITTQIANLLPDNATGLDLCKILAEFLLNDKKGTLHEVVSDIISYEAKKIL